MFASNLLRKSGGFINLSTVISKRCKSKFKEGGHHATFNDMPVPHGCWKEANARRQSRYNMILLSGIGSFIGSVIFVVMSGEMVFNCTVPDYPFDDK